MLCAMQQIRPSPCCVSILCDAPRSRSKTDKTAFHLTHEIGGAIVLSNFYWLFIYIHLAGGKFIGIIFKITFHYWFSTSTSDTKLYTYKFNIELRVCLHSATRSNLSLFKPRSICRMHKAPAKTQALILLLFYHISSKRHYFLFMIRKKLAWALEK